MGPVEKYTYVNKVYGASFEVYLGLKAVESDPRILTEYVENSIRILKRAYEKPSSGEDSLELLRQ